MSSLYLADELEVDAVETGGEVSVTGAEARHAVTVARLRAGEQVMVGNGRGLIIRGPVVSAESSRLVVRAELIDTTPKNAPQVLLVQALAKGDRDELAIQAATELGVDGVIPWSAERSVSRWLGPKVERGVERWRSIVREATKQSIRPWLPSVGGLVQLADICRLAEESRVVVLEPTADTALGGIQFAADQRVDVVLVVGPEGGLSPGELERMRSAGAQLARLGPTVLRTSTAGPAALAVLNGTLGRW